MIGLANGKLRGRASEQEIEDRVARLERISALRGLALPASAGGAVAGSIAPMLLGVAGLLAFPVVAGLAAGGIIWSGAELRRGGEINESPEPIYIRHCEAKRSNPVLGPSTAASIETAVATPSRSISEKLDCFASLRNDGREIGVLNLRRRLKKERAELDVRLKELTDSKAIDLKRAQAFVARANAVTVAGPWK